MIGIIHIKYLFYIKYKNILFKYVIDFRLMSGSESLLFAWNLSKNDTVINLSSFDEVPTEVNLSLCTQSACSILPPLK